MDLLWEDSGALYIKETFRFQPFSCTTHQFKGNYEITMLIHCIW